LPLIASPSSGLGLDWRWGRDWFAYTLIDHDPAINEAMWQNAGLVGVE
jgi:deoxyribodipyrimidine photolyase